MNLKTRKISLSILDSVFSSNLFVDTLLSNKLSSYTLSSSETKFITNLVYGTIRLMGKNDFILSNLYHGDYSKLNNKIKNILRFSIYQIDNVNSSPDYATLQSSVDLAKRVIYGQHKLVNAMLRKYIDRQNDLKPFGAKAR